ncbi:MAG TPA: universal stress protein [Anaerolineae bacterium]|nr:universal stress protein [Anaerolineae bacterium]
MMNDYLALMDFRQARRQAERERLRARLAGRSAQLLSYEEVRRMLRARSSREVGLRDIPLDAIVGSVDRYTDFTRKFLPLRDSDEERWARVQTQVSKLAGLPPIEVYQVGDAYFVRDGNHRVSVARQMGATHIQAYVTRIETRVPLTPDVQPQDLILKAEYADFLERTHLDELRPDADLSVSVPGQYEKLLEHIEVHRYFMGLEQEREIPYQEAVAHWYDTVYLPVVRIIREQDLLRHFPGRTEADLYLWVSEHRAELEATLDWEIEPEAAAADLVSRFSPLAQRRLARLTAKLLDRLTPDEIEGGPAPGTWRQTRRHRDRMFADILVAVGGQVAAWEAVDQAIEIARREEARLLGLHVVPLAEEAAGEGVQALRREFERRCEQAGVRGRLAVEAGKIARRVCERSRWADLVVLRLSHPPAPQPVARLGSGFRTIVRRCPTPVLAVPGEPTPLDRLLLAYDGSPKAREALYVAAYLVARWQASLVIVGDREDARDYLSERAVEAVFVPDDEPVTETIMSTAQEFASDLILMGGYGHSPVVEMVLGSTVDHILRRSRIPVLICR